MNNEMKNNEMKNNDNTYKVKRTLQLQEVLFTELEKSFINYLEIEYVNEGKIFPDPDYEDIEEEVDDIINDFFEGGYIDLNNIQFYEEQSDEEQSDEEQSDEELSDEEQSDEELLQRKINIFLIHNRDWLINLLNSFFIENILK